MALDFGVDTPVNSLWVWIDREVRPETVATLSWAIFTSTDNNLWTPRQVVTNAPISSFDNHIELRFATLSARHLKVVVAPLAPSAPSASDYPSILVTELEAFIYEEAAAAETRRHSDTHRLLYDMRTRLMDALALYWDMSLQWNRTGDSPSQWFIST